MKRFLTVTVDKKGVRKELVGVDEPYKKHKEAFIEAKTVKLPSGSVALEQYTICRQTTGPDKAAEKLRLEGYLEGAPGCKPYKPGEEKEVEKSVNPPPANGKKEKPAESAAGEASPSPLGSGEAPPPSTPPPAAAGATTPPDLFQ